MRSYWPVLPALLLLLPTLAMGQQPRPAPYEAQMLDYVLSKWEESMTKLDHFSASVRRTGVDKVFGGQDVYEGSAKFLKSGKGQPSRALLFMQKKGDASKYEKYLYTGAFLYEFVPAIKVLRIHTVPQPKPGQPAIEDNLVALVFGMKAADAKQRYNMKWVADPQNKNKYYHYLQIMPRWDKDKADFSEARLVLTANGFLPRQVWYHEPNGNQKTWDFEKVDVTSPIPVMTFAPGYLERGWRIDRPGLTPAGGNAQRK